MRSNAIRFQRLIPTLDLTVALRAVNSPHGVDEENRNLPQRHKFESTLWQSVVAGTLLAATTADRSTFLAGLDQNLERRLPTGPVGFLVNKRLVRFNQIEDSFLVHGCELLRRGAA